MGNNFKTNLIMTDINTLEKKLSNQQWVGGQAPTAEDKDAFEAMKAAAPSAETHPNVFAWFCLTWKFSDDVRKSWTAAAAAGGKDAKKEGGKKGKGGKKEAPKKKDDDVDDAEAAKEAAAKAKAAATKKPKKVVIAMSLIMLEVKPCSDETDLDALAKRIFSTVTQEGLFWKTEYKKVPIAYGIFKLICGFSCEGEKCSVDSVVERIEELDDMVQSVEIAVFNKI